MWGEGGGGEARGDGEREEGWWWLGGREGREGKRVQGGRRDFEVV